MVKWNPFRSIKSKVTVENRPPFIYQSEALCFIYKDFKVQFSEKHALLKISKIWWMMAVVVWHLNKKSLCLWNGSFCVLCEKMPFLYHPLVVLGASCSSAVRCDLHYWGCLQVVWECLGQVGLEVENRCLRKVLRRDVWCDQGGKWV